MRTQRRSGKIHTTGRHRALVALQEADAIATPGQTSQRETAVVNMVQVRLNLGHVLSGCNLQGTVGFGQVTQLLVVLLEQIDHTIVIQIEILEDLADVTGRLVA